MEIDSPLPAGGVARSDVLEQLAKIERLFPDLAQRRVVAEFLRSLAQGHHLPKDVFHGGLHKIRQVRIIVLRHGTEMLGSELNRRQRILDLVRDLTGHLAPCLQAIGSEDFRHVLRDQHFFVAVGQRND